MAGVYRGLRSPPLAFIRSQRRDRKSTRLNPSHSQISYAVFCLKKKIESRRDTLRRLSSETTAPPGKPPPTAFMRTGNTSLEQPLSGPQTETTSQLNTHTANTAR